MTLLRRSGCRLCWEWRQIGRGVGGLRWWGGAVRDGRPQSRKQMTSKGGGKDREGASTRARAAYLAWRSWPLRSLRGHFCWWSRARLARSASWGRGQRLQCLDGGITPLLSVISVMCSYFSSRYSSPSLIRAASYSLTAASDVTEGGVEMMFL